MKDRYKTPNAVFAIFINNDDKTVLLQKRGHTGYADGKYDFGASGHVERGESLEQAVIREIREELGVEVTQKDVEFSSLIYKNDLDTGNVYTNVYFRILNFKGNPTIMEPTKNKELKWVPLDMLPVTLIKDRKIALTNELEKNHFSELGWENE